jgi:hypothetical protein
MLLVLRHVPESCAAAQNRYGLVGLIVQDNAVHGKVVDIVGSGRSISLSSVCPTTNHESIMANT